MLSCGVIGFTSTVLAFPGATGVVAAPGLISLCFGLSLFSKKKEKLIGCMPSSSSSCPNSNRSHSNYIRRRKKLSSQLDAASKWLYVVINDIDTMGSPVGRQQEGVEHTRVGADLGAKNSKSDRILKEVVGELDLNSLRFMEQLEELEEHIYVCLLTITKSRRSLFQEIMLYSPAVIREMCDNAMTMADV